VDREKFLSLAACVDADENLFDLYWFPMAYEPLAYCNKCPVRLECVDYLDPANNYFSGVCGGMVWSSGRRVRANGKQQVIRDRKHMHELAVHKETLETLDVASGTIIGLEQKDEHDYFDGESGSGP
jgi:hypothetical protein